MKKNIYYFTTFLSFIFSASFLNAQTTYKIVDANQSGCFDSVAQINCPAQGSPYFGQDAQYQTNSPSYTNNSDGTISDNNTGLMWQKAFLRMAFTDYNNFLFRTDSVINQINNSGSLGGYNDWRLPDLKTIFSIADMNGNVMQSIPYIDTNYFDFSYPNNNLVMSDPPGTRKIDAQYVSSTKYVGLVNNTDEGFLSFNFADGHIKTYRYNGRTTDSDGFYIRLVRGNTNYGINNFVDNGDGTVTDNSTGLMWQKTDDGVGKDWKHALDYAENLTLAGYSDWRLPDPKELNSILQLTTNNPALDTSMLKMTDITGWFWTSTSFEDLTSFAVYVCFGKAISYTGIDTHGAGAMRGDPKSGNPSDYPTGYGPQNDQVRIYNYVRAVRNVNGTTGINKKSIQNGIYKVYPNPTQSNLKIEGTLSEPGNVQIELFNILGEMVYSQMFYKPQGSFLLNINFHLKTGTYITKVSSQNNSKNFVVFIE